MEKQLVMPKLQPEMKSGVLCAWLKDEGDEIHKGDALYEIETDKVVNQIEATEDGILRRQLCEEGAVSYTHLVNRYTWLTARSRSRRAIRGWICRV